MAWNKGLMKHLWMERSSSTEISVHTLHVIQSQTKQPTMKNVIKAFLKISIKTVQLLSTNYMVNSYKDDAQCSPYTYKYNPLQSLKW